MNDGPRPQPQLRESAATWWLAILGALISLIYLANPGWGVIELIPDNIPGIGNIDEALFTTILIASLSRLGIDIIPGLHRNRGQTIDHPPRDPSSNS